MLNDGIEAIRAWTFAESAVSNIRLPATLVSLENHAFCYCKKLTHVMLPEGLQKIDYDCFKSAGLTEIAIPASVTVIDDSGFYGCQQLKEIAFADGSKLEEVGAYVFYDT